MTRQLAMTLGALLLSGCGARFECATLAEEEVALDADTPLGRPSDLLEQLELSGTFPGRMPPDDVVVHAMGRGTPGTALYREVGTREVRELFRRDGFTSCPLGEHLSVPVQVDVAIDDPEQVALTLGGAVTLYQPAGEVEPIPVTLDAPGIVEVAVDGPIADTSALEASLMETEPGVSRQLRITDVSEILTAEWLLGAK